MKSKHLIFAIVMLAAFAAASFAQTDSAPGDGLATSNTQIPAQSVVSDPSAPAAAIQPVSASPHHTGPVTFRRDGLWFSTADGSTHLQVHGYAQADDRMFSSNTRGEGVDTFLFRRIRPLFEGTLFNQVDFRFMPDFGQYNSQVQEAYLELKTLPFAKLRVGKFKEPIGLEVLRQDRDLTFTERSITSDLLPLRYVGAQLAGSMLGKSINYEGGYFAGSSDGYNAVFTQWTHANEGVARVFLKPFASTPATALQELGFGVAGSAGAQHGAIAGLKTPAQSTFFKYSSTAVADGQHNRLSPQAFYYAGPFGVIGEYVISSQEVLNKGHIGRIRNEAWEVQGSIMLTGDKNSYAGFHPRDSFEPNRGFRHLGAVELAFRYSRVGIDPEAFPLFASSMAAQQARATGIGLNWHVNRYIKLMTDYEHTNFGMASSKATPLHSEDVLTSRVQLAF
ncbi:MAG TPA: porin [Candidatus Sulfotelmatobacter sp.]|nr:porin [Candidatus Sulfotelmatobacter sp.]